MIAALVFALALVAQGPETIAEIRIHGNHVSSDAEVLQLSGVTIGAPFTATTIAEVTAKLKAARKFDSVEVLKRFASIEDPSKITVVIVVDEGPVKIEMPDPTAGPDAPIRVVKRRFGNFMWLPILYGEDGYGFTYGARIAYVGLPNERMRVSFPLSWGGDKKAGAEFEQTFRRGPISRVQFGVARQRQENPGFEINDDRTRVWGRAEHASGPLRVGTTAGWQQVSFAELDDDLRTVGVDVAFDTRLDPLNPRNAVYARAAWEHLDFEAQPARNRTTLEGRGFVGLFGSSVLALRATHGRADGALPPYEQWLLGGPSSVRGFSTGSEVGDRIVSGSIELRLPFSSPLRVAKTGVAVFLDRGAVWNDGQRLADADWKQGYGAGVFAIATVFQLRLDVAHGQGRGTRVHFSAGLSF